VLIVGGTDVGYGAAPDPLRYSNQTAWKDIFVSEVRPRIPNDDWERVHFLGKVSQGTLIQLLQLSTVHVYWTVPFVLSWSLMEAMSVGCTVVASDTEPVREVIHHGKNGRLVDFFNIEGLVDEVISLLNTPEERARLGVNAREYIVQNYDLNNICLPKQLEWVYNLASK
jgi:glycosyltransferase involved in cell wall biosynthesis